MILYLTTQATTEPWTLMTTICVDAKESPAQMKPRVMGMILSVAACLIVSANLLVAMALLKLLLRKRTQSWCFVLNLALADALVGVAITGLATEDFNSDKVGGSQDQQQYRVSGDASANTTAMVSPPGKARCLMRMAFVMSPCTASIMSMFLISLDRYAAIKMPLRYSLLSGKGTAFGFLLTLWISAFTVGFLPMVVPQLQTKDYEGFCAFFSVIHGKGIIILFSICFFPVLLMFVYIYLDILKIAQSHLKQICQVQQAGSRSAERGQGHEPYRQHQHQHHLQHHQQHQQPPLRCSYWTHIKALRMVAVLIGCFLVLWCPFFVVCLVHVLCKSCELTHVLENHLWLLGLCNSLINPLVYAFWQREVRLQLAAMFSCFFTGRSNTAGRQSVIRRNDPQDPVQTQEVHAVGGDNISPTLLRPVICDDRADTAAPFSTISP